MLHGIVVAFNPKTGEHRVWRTYASGAFRPGWNNPQAGADLMTLEDARKVAKDAIANTLNTDYVVIAIIVNHPTER